MATATVTPRPKPENDEAKLWQDFVSQTEEHQLTVLREDGLYRHMRMSAPGTSMWSWTVNTFPGYLTVVGDIADGYTFSRIEDMLNFFELGARSWNYYADGAPCIDFRYWAEKLSGGRSSNMRVYSQKSFLASVTDIMEQDEDLGLEMENEIRAEALECEGDSETVVKLLAEAQKIKSDRDALIEDARYHAENENDAYEWLNDHPKHFTDIFDIDIRTWDRHFVYACYAIALTVKKYREYQAEHPAADDYIILDGGLVQNNPSLPVYNLDVLDSDAPDDDTAQEALELLIAMSGHRSVRLAWATEIDKAEGFVRNYGSEETVAKLERILSNNQHRRNALE